jgi:3-deoxy-7-phosphoheptulonate synthase
MQPWSPDSWRAKPIAQQIDYPDESALRSVLAELAQFPPLVTSWEVEGLKEQLAAAARGERFLLQGGDCAESLDDCRPAIIASNLKVMLKMSLVLIYGCRKRVVRVGRVAGQYAKPRSSPTETRDGLSLPSYRGPLINRPGFTAEERTPRPEYLLEGYHRAALTINFIRALVGGGFADLHHPELWNVDFVRHAVAAEDYFKMVDSIGGAIRFLEAAAGHPLEDLSRVDFYTSHEGLHLEYERAQTRQVPHRGNNWYNLCTHFPWIGDRTRQLDGAHVEYFRGISNPIGVKVGPSMSPDELIDLIERLDPDAEPGRLTLIHRFGAKKLRQCLPPLIDAVLRHRRTVTWCCDPMHGNTVSTPSGVKTRSFDNILEELLQTLDVHNELGSHFGGVHIELTGEDVTECIGGASGLSEADLGRAYSSEVDPRLNYEQALEMAFAIARRMSQGRK